MADKLDLESKDLIAEKLEQLKKLFPNLVTEGPNGKVLDLDQLKNEFSKEVVEGTKERYRLEWPGKKEAIVTANLPTTKTLRPVKEDSVDWDKTENLYIEGDNLEVLKILQESYFGKIKMIYIDPPYNTGKDFVYKDNFSKDAQEELKESGQKDEYNQRLFQNADTSGRYHSDWLSMVYPRLKLARNLLTNDGVIFVSIDDNEVDSLGKLCNEIFGEDNFLNLVTVKTKIGGVSGSSEGKSLKDATEFIWIYAKNKDLLSLTPVHIKTKLSNRIRSYEIEGRSWKYTSIITKLEDKVLIKEDKERKIKYYGYKTLETMSLKSFANLNNLSVEEVYDQYADKIFRTTNAQSSVRQTVIKETAGAEFPMFGCEYTPIKGKNEGCVIEVLYKSGASSNQRNMVMLLSDVVQKIDGTYHYLDRVTSLWDDIEYNNLTKEGDMVFANGKKPIKLLQRMISLTAEEDCTVMDFFSGSGSTSHAVMQLNAEDGGNRKHIMVQLPEATDEKSEAFKAGYKSICEIGKERIRRAGAKIKEETGADIDYGFRVYRLDSSNMADVYHTPQDYDQDKLELFADNVKEDRTADDLLAQIMLDWGLPLSLPIEESTITGKRVFHVAGNSLLACFDSEIDEAFAKEIAKEEPLRIVFKDAGFASDTAKSNVKQLLKQLSPETEMKVI